MKNDLTLLTCGLGKVYNNPQYLITMFFMTFIKQDPKKKLQLCLITIVLIGFIKIIKKLFQTDRPCSFQNNHPCCPSNYDIPSMHSALGVFHGILLFKAGYKKISYFFFMQPILRILGNQHSLLAVIIGTIIGTIIGYSFTKYC